ncbi:lantibiotic protection ABC transporter ATP-binding subunit [Staphylococcus gallinarum]|uniref:lantibiotic protection ABC transporter ATP-binding subunit n=1 Tax=Staphylococcus gallinarum TaxID=1293 RepID=UPI002DB749BB|nr:lantibiotic protection ABC transporter ATP-binding subunit [Staphylococcus gallinarum]MEB6243537.1 lantibiotic protection ABC transporter ATP-binding subunit [Staphylococcus gallinarum]MEB6296577.1 lantibiotic protection ABC transporter ATP-binding subunit [Staphylococcus gallinarum]
MSIILDINKLNKNYKKTKILTDLSIEVKENRIYGLLGPNGAGKTTLLKIITGIITKTSGEVELFNEPWNKKNMKDIGALIEKPAIYENLTAYENLEIICHLLNITVDNIPGILSTVGLHNVDKKISKNFSLGMKQRLGIAMALINNPKLLILDEPTNGLDPIGIQELRMLIKSFPEKGVTVIISSHILSEIEIIADDIGIMANGKIGFEGSVDNHRNDLEDLFIKTVNDNKGVHQ